MNGEAVKEIAALATKPMTIVVGGRTHIARPATGGEWTLTEPDQPDILPATLELGTLAGLVDWLRAEVLVEEPEIDRNAIVVHVVSPSEVRVVEMLDAAEHFPQRAVYAAAKTSLYSETKGFGSYLDQEAFIVWLLTSFVADDQRSGVLRLVGNLRAEAVRQATDDGVSQQVVARRGVVAVENVVVPNPVQLRPYRTFREVDQPTGLFLLRLRGGGDDAMPAAALFEAGSGAWKLEAMLSIKEYLLEHLEGSGLAIIA